MVKYVATRPVTFDRAYVIGEEIPGDVIAPGSAKRLIESGRIAIAPADAPPDADMNKTIEAFTGLLEGLESALGVTHEGDPPSFAERMIECMSRVKFLTETVAKIEAEGSNPPQDDPEGNDGSEGDLEEDDAINDPGSDKKDLPFPCPECDRSFSSQRGLTAHMNTHKG
ncbi:MAG: C2H2-type zinc finger protein [Defluviitaleaceae bacterium]|nr:C2H2-type zinc finger protein [Defluviitaleaceae bacterium]